MTKHSILVLGVGRSGTTAIYSLIQKVLQGINAGIVDLVYEPFLWDRQTFNKPYPELTIEFHKVNSVSIEGLYHHKKIPILVDNLSEVPEQSRLWLRETLSPQGNARHLLAKMIRGNGRIGLIKDLLPDTKVIFIIRNPVDVLNSAAQSFSFFGADYYPSDETRFRDNVKRCFDVDLAEGESRIETLKNEYFFWLYSNLHFLNFSQKFPENILTISYESYESNKKEVSERICKFLGIRYESEYSEFASEVVGPVKQKTSALSPEEFDFLSSRLGDYREMLESVDISPESDIADFIKYGRYDAGNAQSNSTEINWFNSGHASRRLAIVNEKLLELRKKVSDLSQEYRDLLLEHRQLQESQRLRFMNSLLYPLDKYRAYKKRTSKQDL